MSVRLITLGQVADLLAVKPLTVRRWWYAKRFPAPMKIGHVIRWREADVLRWIAERPSVPVLQKAK